MDDTSEEELEPMLKCEASHDGDVTGLEVSKGQRTRLQLVFKQSVHN